MNKKLTTMKVLGKTIRRTGIIFKRDSYVVAILLNNTTTTERTIPYHQYCLLEVGNSYEITMYSLDNKYWYFSEKEVH